MLFSPVTYLGIDPTAGQEPFTYAALDERGQLLALAQGDIEEVLAFVGGQRQAVVAVCAPRRPNQGLMAREDVRAALSPVPRPGRWENCRMVEYELRQLGIQVYLTPRDLQACPRWKQNGFILYQRLEEMGFTAFPQTDSPLQYLEVYPHACFTVWLGQAPFPKQRLEGRLQRQLVLLEQEVDVPDPMRIFEEITRYRLLHNQLPLDVLYSPSELDVLAAAQTAFMTSSQKDKMIILGNPEEGQIVLPVNELKSTYR